MRNIPATLFIATLAALALNNVAAQVNLHADAIDAEIRRLMDKEDVKRTSDNPHKALFL